MIEDGTILSNTWPLVFGMCDPFWPCVRGFPSSMGGNTTDSSVDFSFASRLIARLLSNIWSDINIRSYKKWCTEPLCDVIFKPSYYIVGTGWIHLNRKCINISGKYIFNSAKPNSRKNTNLDKEWVQLVSAYLYLWYQLKNRHKDITIQINHRMIKVTSWYSLVKNPHLFFQLLEAVFSLQMWIFLEDVWTIMQVKCDSSLCLRQGVNLLHIGSW